MSIEDSAQDPRRLQKQALQRAKEAAQAKDPKTMLAALAESRILDGLRRRLDFSNWGGLIHHIDRDLIVGEAVDNFYQRVSAGEEIGHVSGWFS
jgi:hypothetical protein